MPGGPRENNQCASWQRARKLERHSRDNCIDLKLPGGPGGPSIIPVGNCPSLFIVVVNPRSPFSPRSPVSPLGPFSPASPGGPGGLLSKVYWLILFLKNFKLISNPGGPGSPLGPASPNKLEFYCFYQQFHISTLPGGPGLPSCPGIPAGPIGPGDLHKNILKLFN